ncbi:hypothetical protein [Kitasatospora sp. NPDC001175]|uniref:hypothetical protein n=1 Tax=Kitasatospora sp. NPDC001175 TaxID=3157103 RepID=UPI003D00A672
MAGNGRPGARPGAAAADRPARAGLLAPEAVPGYVAEQLLACRRYALARNARAVGRF